MNYDEYGEVINGEKTYKGIAEELGSNAVIVGWSDGNGTHLDILFTLHALRYGDQIQGGINPKSDLFVSIMRLGAFAFEINEADTHPGYYEEKLGNRGPFGEATREALAELLNGVRKLLAKITRSRWIWTLTPTPNAPARAATITTARMRRRAILKLHGTKNN